MEAKDFKRSIFWHPESNWTKDHNLDNERKEQDPDLLSNGTDLRMLIRIKTDPEPQTIHPLLDL